MGSIHILPPRQRPGRSDGGQFTNRERSEDGISLAREVENDTSAWLIRNGFDATDEELATLNLRLGLLGRVPHDLDRADTYRQVFAESRGYSVDDQIRATAGIYELRRAGRDDAATALERLLDHRAAVQGARPVADVAQERPKLASPAADVDYVSSDDQRVQDGQVFDRVESNGRIFHRRVPNVTPDRPTAIRIQADRPLADDEIDQIRDLVAYRLTMTVRGEEVGLGTRDSPYSFVLDSDWSTGHPEAGGRFEENLHTWFRDGSPIRSTDQAGPGTRGTRAVDGLGDRTPRFNLYYDDVSRL